MTTRTKNILLSLVCVIGIVIVSVSLFRDENLVGFKLFMRILSLIFFLGYGFLTVGKLVKSDYQK